MAKPFTMPSTISPFLADRRLIAAAAGFTILLGYEWSAMRFADVKLPARTWTMGGLTAFASATRSACPCCPAARCAIASMPVRGSVPWKWRR